MKLIGSTKNKVPKDKRGENISHLDITVEALVHCNIDNNYYEHDSRVMNRFVSKKSFGQMLRI